MGRLTKDPDVKYSQDGNIHARFTLAVDRRYKKDSEQKADFISCVAFNKTAEFCEKYARKGVKFAVCGRIQTGNYTDKEGIKHYTTDVIVDEMEFAESKQQEEKPAENKPAADDGFVNVPDNLNDELPFA